MNSIDFLKSRLKKLHNKFLNCNIRYEFVDNLDIHLVEVTPREFFDNLNYIIEELAIDEEFYEAFQNEDLVFISDGSLNKIGNPILELYSEKNHILRADFIVLDNMIGFESSIDESYELEVEYSYTLAV